MRSKDAFQKKPLKKQRFPTTHFGEPLHKILATAVYWPEVRKHGQV